MAITRDTFLHLGTYTVAGLSQLKQVIRATQYSAFWLGSVVLAKETIFYMTTSSQGSFSPNVYRTAHTSCSG